MILSGSRFFIFILFLQNNNHHFSCENDIACIIIGVDSKVVLIENGGGYTQVRLLSAK